jgi:hypothetical protein
LEYRELNIDEERVLRLMLDPAVDEQSILLSQLPFARVTRHWIDGLPSIDIEVEAGADRATTTERLLPMEGQVSNENGDPTGLILVWLEGGALAGLEYAWYSDEPPTEWPPTECISIGVRADGA